LQVSVPRVLVAGLRGGGGKTLLSLGLAASFRSRGLVVAPFKKGPDYIDASWLSHAAGNPCRNLDLFLFSPQVASASFRTTTQEADLAIIEGNRGLFDGMDPEGTFSSAELAKLLACPVLLAVDATKTTRTAAALVLGCQTMDPEVRLAGVVLNRVAGRRHETVLRSAIERTCGLPVLGAIPKLPDDLFPERHLGLVPPQETEELEGPISGARRVAEEFLDLDAIFALARAAPPLPGTTPPEAGPRARTEVKVRIGVFRDAAFQFYYPENLEQLVEAGGELVQISPLEDRCLPEVDALYLGGGFPETLAPGLSRNQSFMASVRVAAEAGLPIYAECGGAVYLGESLDYGGQRYPLVGALPVTYGFQSKPRGHGYSELEVVGGNPFFPRGRRIRGHEFHYTYMLSPGAEELEFAFQVHRGYGFDGIHDGLRRWQVLASYTHVHGLGVPEWALSMVDAAARFRSGLSVEQDSSDLT
jgi:cobyrinic acid a,c-diamide synthase